MVEAVAGTRPPTCPWRAYHDPVVRQVLDAYGSVQSGMGATTALLLAHDPPHIVWQGVNFYRHVSAKVREHDDKLPKKTRPRG